jgi:hypothetical protein
MCEPDQEDDALMNTDLIISGFDSVRIACRIRKYKYFSEYGNEITVGAGHINDILAGLSFLCFYDSNKHFLRRGK